jgi:hypothetical protein
MVDSQEPSSHVGIKYNYDPSLAESSGKFLKISPDADVQFKIFKITRAALTSMIERTETGDVVVYTEGIHDGKKESPDQRFMRLWGDVVYADITQKTKNVGPFDFAGIVGNQKQLR